MKNPNVRLADVAARAGMSAATASRALRGLRVHKKYQGKAEAAAAELGYVLNEAARSLRNVRTMTVGMVYFELTSLLGMELLGSVTAGLDDIGYSLFVSTAQGKPERFDQLVHRFLQRRVDALVCVHSAGEGGALEGYAAAGIPIMALITKSGGYRGLPMIAPTITGASADCIERLCALKHRLVAILAPDRLTLPVDSFIATAKAKRLKLIRHEINAASFDNVAVLRMLLSRQPRPTAVVALHSQARQLVDAAAALGVRVPADLSVVAIRDRSVVSADRPTVFSTIHLDPRPMGQEAASVLKAWLVDGIALRTSRKVEIGSWVESTTTGPAPVGPAKL